MVYSGCLSGLLIVGSAIVSALFIVSLARRHFSAATLRDGHDATGNLLAIVGTLYAVLLGLVVVDAMAHFQQAMDGVQTESNCLADIFLLAERLPEPQRGRVQGHCRDYAREVVDHEWPAMATGRMSVPARRTALSLIRSLDDFEPVTEAQKAVYPVILEQMRGLWDCRRDRGRMTEFGIPSVEWVVLAVGGAVTIYFAGLFSLESGRLQNVITALTALVIGLNLYLVSLFGYPFAGELTVSKRPFQLDLAIFDGAYTDMPAHAPGTVGAPADTPAAGSGVQPPP